MALDNVTSGMVGTVVFKQTGGGSATETRAEGVDQGILVRREGCREVQGGDRAVRQDEARISEWPQSARPYRSNPPQGAVGLVIPTSNNLKFFKATFFTVLDFTDYRYMLTVVNSMGTFTTRQYLDSMRKNHFINVLQFNEEHDVDKEVDLAIRFMFAFQQVEYGAVILPGTMMEPNWLSCMVKELDGGIGAVVPSGLSAETGAIVFKRKEYEQAGKVSAIKAKRSNVVLHRMTRLPFKDYFAERNGTQPSTKGDSDE
jgi:hypothetical protein